MRVSTTTLILILATLTGEAAAVRENMVRYTCSGGSQFGVNFHLDSVNITSRTGNRYSVPLVMRSKTELRYENSAVLFVRRNRDSSFHIADVLYRGCNTKDGAFRHAQ
jgi:hypothetical protein